MHFLGHSGYVVGCFIGLPDVVVPDVYHFVTVIGRLLPIVKALNRPMPAICDAYKIWDGSLCGRLKVGPQPS